MLSFKLPPARAGLHGGFSADAGHPPEAVRLPRSEDARICRRPRQSAALCEDEDFEDVREVDATTTGRCAR